MNLTELYQHLGSLYEDLKGDAIKPNIAKEMNNTAGKMIAIAKVQLRYVVLRQKHHALPAIPFIRDDAPSGAAPA
jgi:chemotaxis regulatin CheY-phosphate phosphatase CheZ